MGLRKNTGRWETYLSMFVAFLLFMAARIGLDPNGSGSGIGLLALSVLGFFAAWGMTESLIAFRSQRKKVTAARQLQLATD